MPPKRRASLSDQGSSKRARPVPGWTTEDQTILEATTAPEITLWKRFHRRFNDTPLNVLEDLIIATDPDKKLKDQDGELTIENTNWSKAFCEQLNHLVCIPFFQDHPNLLRYAMKRAHWARAGGEKPEIKEIIPTRNNDFVDKLIAGIDGLGEDHDVVQFITNTTIQAFGRGKPRHSGFLSHIDHASRVQLKGRGRHGQVSGIAVGDISTIIRAWDTYATLRENMEELKVVADYFEVAKVIRDGPSKEEILRMKKEWIIKSRQSDSQSSSGSSQETPGPIIQDSQTDVEIPRVARPSTTSAGPNPPGRLPTTSSGVNPPTRPSGTSSGSNPPAPPSSSGPPPRPSTMPSGSNPPPPKSPVMPVPRRNHGPRRTPISFGSSSDSSTIRSFGSSPWDSPAPSDPPPQQNASSGQAIVPAPSKQASQFGIDVPDLHAWPKEPLEPCQYDHIRVPFDFNRVTMAYWPIELTLEEKDDFGETPYDQNWHIAAEDYQTKIDRANKSWLAGELPEDLTRDVTFPEYTRVVIDYPRPPEGVAPGRRVKVVEWQGPPLDPSI